MVSIAPFLSRVDRPKILYVILQEEYSGAETMHASVMQADADPLLACPPGSATESWARSLGVATAPIPFRVLRRSGGLAETIGSLGRGVASIRDLRRLLVAHPDRRLVYCTSIRPGMIASLATVGLRRRVLWTVCEFMPPAAIRGPIRLLASLRCHAVLAHSRAVGRDFVRRSRRLRRRSRVIYLPGSRPGNPLADQVQPGRPRAVIVGTIAPNKRVDLAVAIASQVVRELPEFELLVVGKAQFREENQAYERDLRAAVASDPLLRDRVRFVGWAADVRGVMAQCGLILHCSETEPLGGVLLEAMELGLPAVVAEAGGPAEIVVDGVTGLHYEPGSAEQGAEKVLAILRDPELAHALSHATLEAVGGRLSADSQLRGADELIASAASHLEGISQR